MASRFPTLNVLDYCFHPVHVVDDTKDIFVPCGKCDGCLLHKANEWSIRLGMELEDSTNNIFFTLTYDNEFLPRLIKSKDEHESYFGFWYSDNIYNWRFDGTKKVRRLDHIIFKDYGYEPIPVTNLRQDCINYFSKRDFQLYLKLLREDIKKNLHYDTGRTKENGVFRYFFISEVGPTTLRNHGHGILFCKSHEISEYLLSVGLYKNWAMCDKSRIVDYSHYCDSGARGYVTQYLTCTSDLPRVYQENKEIRPFRLASKSPAIGYRYFDKSEIQENLSVGITEYHRRIARLGVESVLKYPKNLLTSLFPKCFEYGQRDFPRLLAIYGSIWREVVFFGRCLVDVVERFSNYYHPLDYAAARACYKYCTENSNDSTVVTPFHYLFLLDNYYYSEAMDALEYFYNYQIETYDKENFSYIISLYVNFKDVVNKAFLHVGCYDRVLEYFLEGFGFTIDSFDFDNPDFYRNHFKRIEDYKKEVESIKVEMIKTAKVNEVTGVAPTIV